MPTQQEKSFTHFSPGSVPDLSQEVDICSRRDWEDKKVAPKINFPCCVSSVYFVRSLFFAEIGDYSQSTECLQEMFPQGFSSTVRNKLKTFKKFSNPSGCKTRHQPKELRIVQSSGMLCSCYISTSVNSNTV